MLILMLKKSLTVRFDFEGESKDAEICLLGLQPQMVVDKFGVRALLLK